MEKVESPNNRIARLLSRAETLSTVVRNVLTPYENVASGGAKHKAETVALATLDMLQEILLELEEEDITG